MFLSVITPEGESRYPFAPGRSVKEILDATADRVAATCGGAGACGLCRIRVEEGTPAAPTAVERLRLSAQQLRDGERLACQVRPASDLCVTLVNPAPRAEWRSIGGWDEEWRQLALFSRPARPSNEAAPAARLGLAVDLGTTHIRVALWDLSDGGSIATRAGGNPQTRFGADVLTRLAAAGESEQDAGALAEAARGAMGAALADIRARDLDASRRAAPLHRILIVGNTAMLALLTGTPPENLLHPDAWEREVACRPIETARWAAELTLDPAGCIEVVQPLAGFVGSDLLAGVAATRLLHDPPGSLFIDFGTNTEIALWDGDRLWVTSAAGGPAFEGSGLHSGMPAEAGAVASVSVDGAGQFGYSVIGGGAPRGFCGSGLVDMVACLRRTGRVNLGGRLTVETREHGRSDPALGALPMLTAADVDALQRAKAGVAAAIAHLAAGAGIAPHHLRRVCVTGAFGRYLNVANAAEIGLLPPMSPECVELYENSALAGCSGWLVGGGWAAARRAIVERSTLINLSLNSSFEETFIENLRLRPMQWLPERNTSHA